MQRVPPQPRSNKGRQRPPRTKRRRQRRRKARQARQAADRGGRRGPLRTPHGPSTRRQPAAMPSGWLRLIVYTRDDIYDGDGYLFQQQAAKLYKRGKSAADSERRSTASATTPSRPSPPW